MLSTLASGLNLKVIGLKSFIKDKPQSVLLVISSLYLESDTLVQDAFELKIIIYSI